MDSAGNQLMFLSPEERAAAITSGDGLLWGGLHGVTENGGVPPNLEARPDFIFGVNVQHLSEEFGPDVLMDQGKFQGEVIHTLTPTEFGMFRDLGWTPAAAQPVPVPEPAAVWLLLGGVALALVLAGRDADWPRGQWPRTNTRTGCLSPADQDDALACAGEEAARSR